MLKINNLTNSYNGKTAVFDLTLHVKKEIFMDLLVEMVLEKLQP